MGLTDSSVIDPGLLTSAAAFAYHPDADICFIGGIGTSRCHTTFTAGIISHTEPDTWYFQQFALYFVENFSTKVSGRPVLLFGASVLARSVGSIFIDGTISNIS